MPAILTVTTSLLVAYLSTFIYCLIRNFFNARKTGVPSVVVPWDQNHIIWMIISVPLRPWLRRNLPKLIWDRISLCIYGFEFHEKLRPFEQYSGPQGNDKSYMLVTCGRPEFWTRDPEITTQILSRPTDFVPHELTTLLLSKFGHNVFTAIGDRWTRQRKIVAGVINERISKRIFNETVNQTEGLLSEISKCAVDGVAETTKLFDMAKKITIHVLNGAGMGKSVPWDDDMTEQPEPGFKQTYIQSVKTVINNMSGGILLPQWFLLNYPRLLPGYSFCQSLGQAVQEFPKHTLSSMEQERKRSKEAGETATRNNIMSQLLQASEQTADTEAQNANIKGAKALTDDEIMGNLFVFTAAGFDTTANTVSYALVLLARYPQWQEWLFEEIDTILSPDCTTEMDYAATFPKATRLLSFMLETLRLFTPLVHIYKQAPTPQTIQTSLATYWLPANTTVCINAIALHLDPEVWEHLNLSKDEKRVEDDTGLFRPSRWINPPGSPQLLFQPPKGTYIPWSGGPRVCPGQKMAQVEFVAIFITLLRAHRVDAVALEGESRADVENRLESRMNDSLSLLTLQMNDVYDVASSKDKGLLLRLSKRR